MLKRINMGFLSKLFGSNKQETVPKKNVIENIIDKYANVGDFNSIIRELDSLELDTLTNDLLEDWCFLEA